MGKDSRKFFEILQSFCMTFKNWFPVLESNLYSFITNFLYLQVHHCKIDRFPYVSTLAYTQIKEGPISFCKKLPGRTLAYLIFCTCR